MYWTISLVHSKSSPYILVTFFEEKKNPQTWKIWNSHFGLTASMKRYFTQSSDGYGVYMYMHMWNYSRIFLFSENYQFFGNYAFEKKTVPTIIRIRTYKIHCYYLSLSKYGKF